MVLPVVQSWKAYRLFMKGESIDVGNELFFRKNIEIKYWHNFGAIWAGTGDHQLYDFTVFRAVSGRAGFAGLRLFHQSPSQ
jgi:hypothetical protein